MSNVYAELEHLYLTPYAGNTICSYLPPRYSINGYNEPCAWTPAPDPDYIFQEASRDVAMWLAHPADPLYIYGPTGCGKTSCVKQMAARLNYPVFEITGHGRLEFGDIVGHLSVQGGDMVYEYGPLALAMRYGGLLLFNEIDLTSPEMAAGLHGVLDGSPLCIAENGGEIIPPHPMFRFCATANTNGGGDDTGLYQGTQRQNLAFADRFVLTRMTYPERSLEVRLLRSKFPSIPQGIASKLVSYANKVRKLFMGEAASDNITNCIEVTFSTRSLLRWADLLVRYKDVMGGDAFPFALALDRALGFRASPETRAVLHELLQRILPEGFSGESPISAKYAKDAQ